MFSSFFGKRRSSPVEDNTPPIPGARGPDDGFVMIDPNSAGGGLYPNVSGGTVRYPQPQRPAPPAPPQVRRATEDPTFHYLQGVPFTLSKGLQMATSKDSYSSEINDILVFLSSKMNMTSYDYDFTVEKSVLKESV